jgi:hypothetical protein
MWYLLLKLGNLAFRSADPELEAEEAARLEQSLYWSVLPAATWPRRNSAPGGAPADTSSFKEALRKSKGM